MPNGIFLNVCLAVLFEEIFDIVCPRDICVFNPDAQEA